MAASIRSQAALCHWQAAGVASGSEDQPARRSRSSRALRAGEHGFTARNGEVERVCTIAAE